MRWSRCRRAAGLYLSLFFLAVAAAPHRHINDLEDLLFDQRSDSGTILQSPSAAGPTYGEGFAPVRIVQDFPCLACFGGDFVSVPVASFLLVTVLAPLPLLPTPPAAVTPEPLPTDPSSRAPPLAS